MTPNPVTTLKCVRAPESTHLGATQKREEGRNRMKKTPMIDGSNSCLGWLLVSHNQ